jgi:hypothetical protein
VDVADRIFFGLPLAISRQMLLKVIEKEMDEHSERYDALEHAGFKLDRYPDPYLFVSVRLGGHHLDVGAGKKIVSGQVSRIRKLLLACCNQLLCKENDGKLTARAKIILSDQGEIQLGDQTVHVHRTGVH